MARTPGTTRVLAVAYTERQAEIISRLYEHELPHCGGDQRRAVASVNQAVMRQSQNRSGAFHLSIDLLDDLLDAGLPVHLVLDALEWSWEGLQEAKMRFAPPPFKDDEIAIHERAVEEIVAALHGTWREVLLRSPRHLRTVIRSAWRHRWRSHKGLRQALDISAALVNLSCDESDLTALFRALADESLVGLGLGISSGAIAKDEALAIARNAKVIAGLDVDTQQRALSALSSLRGRVRPDRFLRTTQVTGVDAAIALHALTGDTTVAIRANVARQRYVLSLTQYLRTYEVMRERASIDFADYVDLSERWAPDVLQSIYAAYRDVALLRRLTDSGQATMVERSARAGVPFPTLARFEGSLFRYLKPRPEAEWLDAAQAFERWGGNATDADAYLALPATLRDHPVARILIEQSGAAVLSDRPLLDLAMTIADSGQSVELSLLRAFRTVGSWPQRRHLVRVYGLARQFHRCGEPPDRAVVRALSVYDQMAPHTCQRAMGNLGYFRYHVLGERPRSVAIGSASTEATIMPVRPRRPSAPVLVAELAAARPALVIDLRTVHHELRLHDLVPERVDPETTSALIVYGLCDLGQCVPFAGRHAIPERHIRTNVRRRFDPNEDDLTAAWRWLTSIETIHEPKRGVYALNLNGDSLGRTAQEVAARTMNVLRWFRAQTRHQ